MKKLLGVLLAVVGCYAHGQGTFVYDQQSTNPPSIAGDYLNIQEDSPLTQSFIPTLSAIGLVQMEFWDIPNNGNNGATVYVNLWTGSPDVNSATLLGSTTPVYMPDGFGGISPGVTNFYFSSPISLTPGRTYYLQPVVQSGDDPWDIWNPGNTYPNGQLYGGAGGFTAPFQPNTDLWFREGVVPEPTALALLGLSGFLFLKRRNIRKLLFILGFLFLTFATNASQVYYLQSLGGAGSAPLPMNPDSSAAVEEVSPGVYVIQDGEPSASSSRFSAFGSRSSMNSEMSSPMVPSPGGTNYDSGTNQYNPDGFTPLFDTNGLWLEIFNDNSTKMVALLLHGTSDELTYQINYTTNLASSGTNWQIGQITDGDVASDETWFTAVTRTNPATFFRAHQATAIMQVWNVTNSIEPNPTNSDAGRMRETLAQICLANF